MKPVILFLLVFFSCQILMADFSSEQAKRVDNFLKKISQKKRVSVFLRNVTFTESELNSYLNIIYLKRYIPEVKYMKLNMEEDNVVSGDMKVKLTGEKYEKVPSFLKNFEVDFSGKVECENYRLRFLFKTLKINGTEFSPEILDEVFYAAQSDFRIKKSMFDWFSLLPGLKDVLISDKKITIYY